MLAYWWITIKEKAQLSQRDRVSVLCWLKCYLWSGLGPSLAALRYVMYFRFCGWWHICPQWSRWWHVATDAATSLQCDEQANACASSYWLRRWARGLDASFVWAVPVAKSAMLMLCTPWRRKGNHFSFMNKSFNTRNVIWQNLVVLLLMNSIIDATYSVSGISTNFHTFFAKSVT